MKNRLNYIINNLKIDLRNKIINKKTFVDVFAIFIHQRINMKMKYTHLGINYVFLFCANPLILGERALVIRSSARIYIIIFIDKINLVVP